MDKDRLSQHRLAPHTPGEGLQLFQNCSVGSRRTLLAVSHGGADLSDGTKQLQVFTLLLPFIVKALDRSQRYSSLDGQAHNGANTTDAYHTYASGPPKSHHRSWYKQHK